MPIERGYGGSVAIGRSVYVMGGGNNNEWLRDTQRLDTATGQWTQVRGRLRGACWGLGIGG